jgi:DNA-binding transcriptional ArsR family regulator
MAIDVDGLFSVLADPTRRHVVQLLGRRPMRAGELADAAGLSPPAMSRHLRVLLQAGVVADERGREDARLRVFHLRPERFVGLQAWLDQLQAHWNEQLGSFQHHVERKAARERRVRGIGS